MDDEQIVTALRALSPAARPVEAAEVLASLLGGQLTQGALVMYFKRAFPAIPLRVLLEAGGWSRVANGEISDEQFNAMLSEWIPISDKTRP